MQIFAKIPGIIGIGNPVKERPPMPEKSLPHLEQEFGPSDEAADTHKLNCFA